MRVLLAVALDDVRGADLGFGRIAPVFTPGAPLAQQVPALVERDLELTQSGLVGILRRARLELALELVLLLDQRVDPGDHVGVIHEQKLLSFYWATSARR